MKAIKYLLFGISIILSGIFCTLHSQIGNSDVLYVISFILTTIGLLISVYGFGKSIYDDAVYNDRKNIRKDDSHTTDDNENKD